MAPRCGAAGLVLILYVGVGGLAGRTPEALREQCAAGSKKADACYELAMLYRSGLGVPRDPAQAYRLLERSCDFGSYQACFSACMENRSSMGCTAHEGHDVWDDVRAFLQADHQRRLEMIAGTRRLSLLRQVRTHGYVELKTLPRLDELDRAANDRLVRIAVSDPDPAKRRSAIVDVRTAIHPDVLREIIRKDPDPEVRQGARERLADDMNILGGDDDAELVKMARSRDREERALAVRRLRGRELLAEIAQKDSDPEIRADAVEGLRVHALEVQPLLVKIAEKDKDERVRAAAVGLIEDRKILERILRSGSNAEVRRMALDRLTDKPVDNELLLRLAEQDGSPEIRKDAAGRIQDPRSLARLATSSPNADVRRIATTKLTDQQLLGEIAVKDRDEGVVVAAIHRVTDDSVLGDVIRRRPDDRVLELVARQTTSQTLLAQIARTAQEWLIRSIAVGRLTTVEVLEEIARTDEVPMVREAAAKRLGALKAPAP